MQPLVLHTPTPDGLSGTRSGTCVIPDAFPFRSWDDIIGMVTRAGLAGSGPGAGGRTRVRVRVRDCLLCARRQPLFRELLLHPPLPPPSSLPCRGWHRCNPHARHSSFSQWLEENPPTSFLRKRSPFPPPPPPTRGIENRGIGAERNLTALG